MVNYHGVTLQQFQWEFYALLREADGVLPYRQVNLPGAR